MPRDHRFIEEVRELQTLDGRKLRHKGVIAESVLKRTLRRQPLAFESLDIGFGGESP